MGPGGGGGLRGVPGAMSKPQWPPQRAATFDLMGSVAEFLGPIGEDTPLGGMRVMTGGLTLGFGVESRGTSASLRG